MQAPPPFSQVPQPPPKKQTPWAIVVALVVAGVVVMGGLVFALFSIGLRLAANPPARVGYGHPVLIKRLDGTRGLYELPEVPMRIELPGPPKTIKFRWTPRTASGIAGWIGYRCQSKVATFSLSGTWYRHPERMDLDKSIQHLLEGYGADAFYENFKGKIYTTKIGPFDGREIRASYRSHNQERAMRLFLWREGDHTFYLSMHASWKYREYGAWEQDEILKSIEFR